MGISKEKIIKAAKEVLSEPLGEYGYQFSKKNFGDGGFSFIKKDETIDICYIIEIQPGGFNKNDLFDMYINISREGISKNNDAGNEGSKIEKYLLRSGDWVFFSREKFKTVSWKWHFQTEQEVKNAFNEVLPNLIQYVLPFLEDPDTSRKDYFRFVRG